MSKTGRVCDSCEGEVPLLEPACSVCGSWISQNLEISCECGRSLRYDPYLNQCRCGKEYNDWEFVASYVAQNHEPREDLLFSKTLSNPETIARDGGIAIPDGQIENYRISLENGSGLHIKEYDEYYAVHIDEVDPGQNAVGHMVKDATELTLAIGAAGIAVIALGAAGSRLE